MPEGLSLHIGLNSVDPDHYGGWSGDLTACEADALDMAEIALSCGFSTTVTLTRNATRSSVTSALAAAAKSCRAGDIFHVSYAGHGGQLPDLNGDEPDGLDETWCLYDGELVDDEILKLLATFQSGVRILVTSDSCHSGTVVRKQLLGLGTDRTKAQYRAMPAAVALRVYKNNKAFYDPILKNPLLKEGIRDVRASVLLISGCQDHQLSSDGTFNGAFTGALKRTWGNGEFAGDYVRFHQSILKLLLPDQTPNLFWGGARDAAFEAQRPFTI